VKRDYELAFILNPEVSEEETRSILERLDQIVANFGGQVVKVNQWGRRRLAYPIERHRDGFYIFIDMILTPETVIELERTLKVSEVVLRYMMKKRDPKAVQKEREDREARAVAAAAAEVAAAEAAAAAPAHAENEHTTTLVTEAEPATTTAEESFVLSPEEQENVPPAIEESETIEA